MKWLILQLLVVFAVVGSNIYWEWTPNGHLASTIGFAATWAITYAQWRGRFIPSREEWADWSPREDLGSLQYWFCVGLGLLAAYLPPMSSFLAVVFVLCGVAAKVMYDAKIFRPFQGARICLINCSIALLCAGLPLLLPGLFPSPAGGAFLLTLYLSGVALKIYLEG